MSTQPPTSIPLEEEDDDLFYHKPPPKRRRGGQPGNRNARKHGFYSHVYTQQETTELSLTAQSHRQNNIKFFKIIIARTAQRIKPSDANPLTFEENVAALHTLTIAISRLLNAINRKHQFLNSKESEYEKDIIEFLRRSGWSQEQIDHELYEQPAPNKRGGQPSNLNALKHGFYSSHYTAKELNRLDKVQDEEDLSDEATLIQILMKRVFIGLNQNVHTTLFLRAVRILAYADACLERLNQKRGLAFGGKSLFEIMQESITEANFEQGVLP